MEDSVLVSVPTEELLELADGLKAFYPESLSMESSARAAARYGHLHLMGGSAFYAPAGELRCCLVVQCPAGGATDWDSLSIFWQPSRLEDAAVLRYLRTLPHLTWRRPLYLRYVPEALHQRMHLLMAQLSGGRLQRRVAVVFNTFLHQRPLPPCQRLADGYVLRRIKMADRARALSDWSDYFMEDERSFVSQCDLLPSLAVYKVLENDQGAPVEELASFAFLKSNGEIGMTITQEAHRRKGLAKLLTWQLTQVASQDGGLPLITITEKNKLSRYIHESLGYESVVQMRQVFYAPDGFDTDWIIFDY